MEKFIIEKPFWDLFPHAKIGVVVLNNFESAGDSPNELVKLLDESNQMVHKHLPNDDFTSNTVIQAYRQAFRQFKTKKGARSSIEALLKRANKGNPVSSINPLVDIYNSASLRYALPIGTFDMDKVTGVLRLTKTDGGDDFYLIGEDKNRPTLEGEICYLDNLGCVSRNLNWRDSKRTMITENSQNAFIVSELLEEDRQDDLESLLRFIEHYAQNYLNAEVKTAIMSKGNSEYILD